MPEPKRLSKQTRGQGAVEGFPRLLGERLCLDFVNTLDSILSPQPEEFLTDYADVAWWGRHLRQLSEGEVTRALQLGEDQPDLTADLFARAITLRDTLTRIFTAIAQGNDVDRDDLNALHGAWEQVVPSLGLERDGDHYRWTWQIAGRDVEQLLWAVIQSTIDTLTTDDLSRIRQCPGAGDCGGLFFDTSRNASRRWCSMEGCGSRVKMRKQYARHTGRGAR